ncbi:hypothetical protein [Xanthobacter versatilis]|uniref:hypothetical protein n=1 Tax=Xanthobacter autotrophicus (strain ATCC BAA-1158 / Py2) TaxID=78245 RepID=UPI0037262638
MKTFYANCRTALSTMGVAAIVSVAMIPASCADPIKTQSYREQQRHEFRHVQNKDHVADSAPTRSATPPTVAPFLLFPFLQPPASTESSGTRAIR